jgi:hypothetical protein
LQPKIDQCIVSYAAAPKALILDFTVTNTPIHGQQQERFFHSYL